MAEATAIERVVHKFRKWDRVKIGAAMREADPNLPEFAVVMRGWHAMSDDIQIKPIGSDQVIFAKPEDLEPAEEESDGDVVSVGSELVVVADDPAAMVKRQADLAAHVRGKMAEVAREIDDARVTIEHAMNAGVNTASLKTIVRRAESRHLYLSKIAEALEAGYLIMPNMDARTIAIRVGENTRPREERYATVPYRRPSPPEYVANSLPAGEGKYVSPHPETGMVHTESVPGKPDEKQNVVYTTGEWRDEIAIPVDFLKPTVVQRLDRAKSLKIFDDFGILPDVVRRKEDPIIVGRINDPRNKRTVSFLVAWFVDTRAI